MCCLHCMSSILTVHLAFGILILVFALSLGWGQSGPRIVGIAIGVEIALGLLVLHSIVTSRIPVPSAIWAHISTAVVAGIAYFGACRVADGGTNPRVAPVLSLVGLALLAFTFFYGRQLFLTHGL